MADSDFTQDGKPGQFAEKLVVSMLQLIEAGDESKRQEIARNVTTILLQTQQEKIDRAVARERAARGAKDPEVLERALTASMGALTEAHALFESALTTLKGGEGGDAITLTVLGSRVTLAARDAADRAHLNATAREFSNG